MASKVFSEEQALLLIQKYGPAANNDPDVCALAKAYHKLITKQLLAEEHWEKLEHEVGCLKRALRQERS